jgi:hypothetical protein
MKGKNKKNSKALDVHDIDLIVMAALRYTLGRSSYMVETLQSFLRTHWDNPNIVRMQHTMLTDLEEFINRWENHTDPGSYDMTILNSWKMLYRELVPRTDEDRLTHAARLYLQAIGDEDGELVLTRLESSTNPDRLRVRLTFGNESREISYFRAADGMWVCEPGSELPPIMPESIEKLYFGKEGDEALDELFSSEDGEQVIIC